ncbi:hypothetical protein PO80_02475 [Vibrio parahaemolyticus]|uniref:GGDEF/EAL domain-containing response regulator n=1 Tax=Vibrio parahaemolyticus TaxID=670 RepID=UPI0005432AC5|nr:EAL domain-containing protein [Vibrio parahaemolyticus]ELU8562247.1 EAL domain-containing protein [Vibrio parahaemolyticus]KHF17363.1 hypothetical protein PO80_02475 [Vibrio parahaemolyticus]OTV96532.1 hypothetical protein BA739_23145 [Vibrio parahaemolyticus]OTW00263.1 hypothetical protein BA740_23820 [Vibrio parahaemolyticus]
MRLLIVEYSAIDRLRIIKTLRDTRLPITDMAEESNVQVGLSLAQRENFDVLLIGAKRAAKNCCTVLTELKVNKQMRTSIIILSHCNDEMLALRYIEAGVQDVVLKDELNATRLRRAMITATEHYALEKRTLEAQNDLRRLTEIDGLTGLSNRYFFDENLGKALLLSSRHHKPLALILIDIDRFKSINNRLGHIVGDEVLREVVRRLSACVGQSDALCRTGGDEFAIVTQNLGKESQVYTLVKRVIKAFQQPMLLVEHSIDVTLSIGIATYPKCASDSVELRKCAATALVRAKEKGRNQAQYYSKQLHTLTEHRIRIENDLKSAIMRNQLKLFYQPQFDRELRLVGAEALIRWIHPELGVIAPDQFIPIAEDSGMIMDIGFWVIKSALKQLSNWSSGLYADDQFRMAVNVSSKQLSDTQFVEKTKAWLSEYNVEPEQVELEMIESCLIRDGIEAESLKELSHLGIKLAIDDFGTGYSSLSHLKDHPIDVIKIDKAFLKNLDNKDFKRLFTAICSLVKTLDYELVAEGVETNEQHALCLKSGVDRLQGFKFSKPLSASSFEKQYAIRKISKAI